MAREVWTTKVLQASPLLTKAGQCQYRVNCALALGALWLNSLNTGLSWKVQEGCNSFYPSINLQFSVRLPWHLCHGFVCFCLYSKVVSGRILLTLISSVLVQKPSYLKNGTKIFSIIKNYVLNQDTYICVSKMFLFSNFFSFFLSPGMKQGCRLRASSATTLKMCEVQTAKIIKMCRSGNMSFCSPCQLQNCLPVPHWHPNISINS